MPIFSTLSVHPVRASRWLFLPVAACLTTMACGETTQDELAEDASELQTAEPEQGYSLDELMTTLSDGRKVRSTLYYGHCNLDGQAVIDAVGGIKVGTFEYFGPDASSSASFLSFCLQDP